MCKTWQNVCNRKKVCNVETSCVVFDDGFLTVKWLFRLEAVDVS